MERYGHRLGNVGIIYKESGDLIGHIGLSREGGRTVLSYALRKDHWCMGLAPEACREVMRHAFEDLGMDEIWTCARAENSAWRGMMERLGMVLREASEDGEVVHYAATAETSSEAMRERVHMAESGAGNRGT